MIPIFKHKEIFIFYSRSKKIYFLSTNEWIENGYISDEEKKRHFIEFTQKRRSNQLRDDMNEISSQNDFSIDTLICYSHEECLSIINALKKLKYKKVGYAPKLSSKSWKELPFSLSDLVDNDQP